MRDFGLELYLRYVENGFVALNFFFRLPCGEKEILVINGMSILFDYDTFNGCILVENGGVRLVSMSIKWRNGSIEIYCSVVA